MSRSTNQDIHSLQLGYWESLYSNRKLTYPESDALLMDRLVPLCKNKKVLEIGCGNGVVSIALHKEGVQITASDFSEMALRSLHRIEPEIPIVRFDMTRQFPFIDDYFDIVVAELSLHYFDVRRAKRILTEISRVLIPEGILAFRVNRIDKSIPPNGAQRIGKDFYLVDNITKKYYSVDTLTKLLDDNWSIIRMEEQTTYKYHDTKSVIFCVVQSKKH